MSEKGPLCVRFGGKTVILSAVASYWSEIDNIHFMLKSGVRESLYVHNHKDKNKIMIALAGYFNNIVEEDDE